MLSNEWLTYVWMIKRNLISEYDACVIKIVEFEREIASYRKENHELKKNNSMLIEK